MLDELNLAPMDVLEALNRPLDDNLSAHVVLDWKPTTYTVLDPVGGV